MAILRNGWFCLNSRQSFLDVIIGEIPCVGKIETLIRAHTEQSDTSNPNARVAFYSNDQYQAILDVVEWLDC